jgi:predicted nucleotidyltransferase
MRPKLDILPSAQRSLWPHLRELPDDFVLYGGTAIALRLGHRESIDFDFFTDEPLPDAQKDRLKAEMPFLRHADVIQSDADTFTLLAPIDQSTVKISFFGGLKVGRVAKPDKTDDEVACVASLEDLLAHKLKVIHDRAEGKDYQDIAEMLEQGMDLAHGLGGRLALFGPSVPTMTTVKALTWFKDINEPWRLPDPSRQIILEAVRKLPARIPEVEIEAATLRCASGSSYTP